MKIAVKRIDPAFPTRVAFLLGIVASLFGIIVGLITSLGSKPDETGFGFIFFLGILSSLILYPLGTYIVILLLNILLKKKGLELDVEKIGEITDSA